MFAGDDITAYASSSVIARFEAGETPGISSVSSSGGGGLSATPSGYFISLP